MKLKGNLRLGPTVSVNWPRLIRIHKADLLQLRKEVPCTKDIWKREIVTPASRDCCKAGVAVFPPQVLCYKEHLLLT